MVLYSNQVNIQNQENARENAKKIREKYPNTVPVFISKNTGSMAPDIDKNKYLVPNDYTASQFLYVIRKRLRIDASTALYIMYNNTVPKSSATMLELFNELEGDDGLLTGIYELESTFGS